MYEITKKRVQESAPSQDQEPNRQSPTPTAAEPREFEPQSTEQDTPFLDTVQEQVDNPPFPDAQRRADQTKNALKLVETGDFSQLEELREDKFYFEGALGKVMKLWQTTDDPKLKEKLAPYAFESRLEGQDNPFSPSNKAYNTTMFQAYDGDPTSIRAMLRVAMDADDRGSDFQHTKSRDVLEHLAMSDKHVGTVADALLEIAPAEKDHTVDVDVYGLLVQTAEKLGDKDPRHSKLMERARAGLKNVRGKELEEFVTKEFMGREYQSNPAILDVLGQFQKRDALQALDERFSEERKAFTPTYSQRTSNHAMDTLAPHVLANRRYASGDPRSENNNPERLEQMRKAFEVTAELARDGDPIAIAKLAEFASFKAPERYDAMPGNFKGRNELLTQVQSLLSELGDGEHGSAVTDAVLAQLKAQDPKDEYANPELLALLGNAGKGLKADDPRTQTILDTLTKHLDAPNQAGSRTDESLAQQGSALTGLEHMREHLGEKQIRSIGDVMSDTDPMHSVRAGRLFVGSLDKLSDEDRQPMVSNVAEKMGLGIRGVERKLGDQRKSRDGYREKLTMLVPELSGDDFDNLMNGDWTRDHDTQKATVLSAIQDSNVDLDVQVQISKNIAVNGRYTNTFQRDPGATAALVEIAAKSKDPSLEKQLHEGVLEHVDPTKIQSHGAMLKAKSLDFFAQMLVEQNMTEILHHSQGGTNLRHDMFYQVPQYYDVGMAHGFKEGKKILDRWLKGMEYGKDLMTLDPKAFNPKKYFAEKGGKEIKDKLIEHLQKTQIESDNAHEIVTQLKNLDALSSMAGGYKKPEDPARRAARIGFDVLTIVPTLIKNDLDTQGIVGEQRRAIEYHLLEKWMEALPSEMYGDIDGTPRTEMPDIIKNPPEGFDHLSGLVQHLWARRYTQHRQKNPREYGPGVKIPEHGSRNPHLHPKVRPLFWDDNRGEYRSEPYLTRKDRKVGTPYSLRKRRERGLPDK